MPKYTEEYLAKETARMLPLLDKGRLGQREFDQRIDAMNGKIPDFLPPVSPQALPDEMEQNQWYKPNTPQLERRVSLDEFLVKFPDVATASKIAQEELLLGLRMGIDGGVDRLRYFVAQLQEGDELWFWVLSMGLGGTGGYVIFRNGQAIDYIQTYVYR